MIRAILLVIMLLIPLTARAAPAPPDMDYFAQLPVIHDGRLKPMESFALIHLLRFSGQRSINGIPASHWLAELLFDPAGAAERPVFKVRDLELKGLLDLPARASHLYSFTEINPGLMREADRIRALASKQPHDLTPSQSALLDLQENVALYVQLMRSLNLILPLNVTVPDALNESAAAPDYLALQALRKKADDRLSAIVRKKGEDVESWTDAERDIAAFSWQMQIMDESGAGNVLLRVIPAAEGWVSPWSMVQDGHGSPEAAKILDQWKSMAAAWIGGDADSFESAARDARGLLLTSGRLTSGDRARLSLEILYQKTRFFDVALLFYALALITVAAATRWAKIGGYAAVFCAGGVFFHFTGMAARIFILARPPVGTLYESLLFVSLVCALAALALRRNPLTMLGGLMAAAALLYLSHSFLPASGDSLEMLVAVLNTNFWLATHVVCITAGYGFSILAGVLAHLWLVSQVTNRPGAGLFPVMHKTALIALLFTAVGTILGGIWADQSWGRFWGWDPKENGALLIVLWLLWLLHGRMAGILKPLHYAAGMASITVIVALAWLGVNLLSIGLHSYGFTSGIAWSLGLFCAAELSAIAIMTFCARKPRT